MSGSLDLSVAERASLFDALRQAAERSGTGLAITDISTAQPRNLFVSSDLARMMGYEPHEAMTRDPWSMIAPEELPRLKEMAALRAAGEKVPGTFETVLLHRSGARIAIELAQSRTLLDGHPVTVTFVNDISSRAATSQALRESEKRFRDLVDGAPDGVAILRGPNVMFLNARAAKLLGLRTPRKVPAGASPNSCIPMTASARQHAFASWSWTAGWTSAPSTVPSTAAAKSTRSRFRRFPSSTKVGPPYWRLRATLLSANAWKSSCWRRIG